MKKLIVTIIGHFHEWFYGPFCPSKEELAARETPELNNFYDDLINQIKEQKLHGEWITTPIVNKQEIPTPEATIKNQIFGVAGFLSLPIVFGIIMLTVF